MAGDCHPYCVCKFIDVRVQDVELAKRLKILEHAVLRRSPKATVESSGKAALNVQSLLVHYKQLLCSGVYTTDVSCRHPHHKFLHSKRIALSLVALSRSEGNVLVLRPRHNVADTFEYRKYARNVNTTKEDVS